MNDLAQDPKNEAKVKELFTDLVQLQKDMDDELDLTGKFPQLINK